MPANSHPFQLKQDTIKRFHVPEKMKEDYYARFKTTPKKDLIK